MPSLQIKENKTAFAVTYIGKYPNGSARYSWHRLGKFRRVADAKVAFEKWIRDHCPSQAKGALNLDTLAEIYWRHVPKAKTTVASERGYLRATVDDFGMIPVHKITQEMVIGWRNNLTEKYSANTVRLRLGFLKSLIKFAFDQGYIAHAPTDKVRPPVVHRSQPKYLSQEIIAKLIEHSNGKGKLMLAMLYYTGMRPIELKRLTAENVDLGKNTITILPSPEVVHKTKNKNPKIIPIHDNLKPLLKDMIPATGTICYVDNLKRTIAIAKRRAGFKEHITPYMLRHSFATHILEASPDDKTLIALKELMGHSTIDTTLIYARPLVKRLESTIHLLK